MLALARLALIVLIFASQATVPSSPPPVSFPDQIVLPLQPLDAPKPPISRPVEKVQRAEPYKGNALIDKRLDRAGEDSPVPASCRLFYAFDRQRFTETVFSMLERRLRAR